GCICEGAGTRTSPDSVPSTGDRSPLERSRDGEPLSTASARNEALTTSQRPWFYSDPRHHWLWEIGGAEVARGSGEAFLKKTNKNGGLPRFSRRAAFSKKPNKTGGLPRFSRRAAFSKKPNKTGG